LADDLGRFLKREPIEARAISFASRAWRWCRRNPWPTVAAVALVIVVALASVSAITYRQRLWQSLLEQTRAERLAGNRTKSLERAAEAARIKTTMELRQEAIQTITTPGLHLLREFPAIHFATKMAFSPDARMLAFIDGGATTVWEINSGRQLARIEDTNATDLPSRVGDQETEIVHLNHGYAFSPTAPLLARAETTARVTRIRVGEGYVPTDISIKDTTVDLWDLSGGHKIATIKREDSSGLKREEMPGLKLEGITDEEKILFSVPSPCPLRFSPDGLRLTQGDWLGRIWIIDIRNRFGKIVPAGGEMLGFLSNDEILLTVGESLRRFGEISLPVGGHLRRWNMTTKESHLTSPPGGSYLAISADHRTAAFRAGGPGRPKDSIIIWDIQAGKQIGILPTAAGSKSQVLLSNDGQAVATYDPAQPKLIELWKMSGEVYRRLAIALPSHISIQLSTDQAAFNADGSLLSASGNESGKAAVWIWETATGREAAVLRDNAS
jgi:WD40 repeat protein